MLILYRAVYLTADGMLVSCEHPVKLDSILRIVLQRHLCFIGVVVSRKELACDGQEQKYGKNHRYKLCC